MHNIKSLTATNWTPPANLPNASYRWWMIAIGPNGLRGLWTPPVDFSVGGNTILLTPTGTTNNLRPNFTWKTVDGAVRYELWVTNVRLNIRPVYQTNRTTTGYTPPSSLATRTYRAWVRAVSSTGTFGPWSVQADFVIAHVEPDYGDLPASSTLVRLKSRDVPDLQLIGRQPKADAFASVAHTATIESAPVLGPSNPDETLYDAVIEELTHQGFTG